MVHKKNIGLLVRLIIFALVFIFVGAPLIIKGVNYDIDTKATAIDKYFEEMNAPLAGYGKKFVIASEKHDLDWRLLPAIAWKESHGGKSETARHFNNPFGVGDPNFWRFASFDEAIERTAKMLGGKSRYYHPEMTTREILETYNGVEEHYPRRVLRIMKRF